MADYREYLRSDHWRRTRRDVLEQRGRRCEVCQSRHAIHVHHRTYARLGAEHPADLLVLCQHCHELVHETQRQRRIRLDLATDIVAANAIDPVDVDEPLAIKDLLVSAMNEIEVRYDNSEAQR